MEAGDVTVRLRLDTSGFAGALARAGQQFSQLGQRLGQLGGTLDRGLGGGLSRVGQGLGRLPAVATQATGGIARAFDRAASAGRSLQRVVFNIQTAMAALGAGLVVRGLIKTQTTFESMETRLISLTGSLDKTAAAMRFITQLTAETSLQLEDTTQAYIRLTAAGLDATTLLPQLVEGVSAFGGTGEILDRVIRQFTQMIAKNRVLSEDLTIIAETGLPVFDILREKLHLTDRQMGDLSQSGVTALQAITAIGAGMQERFGGSSLAQAKALGGILSNIADSITIFEKRILDSGLGDYFRGIASQIQSTLGTAIDANGQSFAAWTATVVRGLDEASFAVGRLIDTVTLLYRTINKLGDIPGLSWLTRQMEGSAQITQDMALALDAATRGQISWGQALSMSSKELEAWAKAHREAMTIEPQGPRLPAEDLSVEQRLRRAADQRKQLAEDFRKSREEQARNARPVRPVEDRPAVDTEALDKAANSLKRFQEALRTNQGLVALFGESLDTVHARVGILRGRLEDLLGQPPSDATRQEIARLRGEIDATQAALANLTQLRAIGDLGRRINDVVGREIPFQVTVDLQFARTPGEAVDAAIGGAQARLQEWSHGLDQAREQLRGATDPTTWQRASDAVAFYEAKIREVRGTLQGLNDERERTAVTTDLGHELAQQQRLLQAQGLSRDAREAELEVIERLRRARESGIEITPAYEQQIRAQADALVQLRRASEDAERPLRDFAEGGQSAFVHMQEALRDVLGSLEDQLVEFFTSGKGHWQDFASAITRDLNRVFVREFISKPLAAGLDQLIHGPLAPGLNAVGLTPRPAPAMPPLAIPELTQAGTAQLQAAQAQQQAAATQQQAAQAQLQAAQAGAGPAAPPTGVPPAPPAPATTLTPIALPAHVARYADQINAAAAATGVDPLLIAAVIGQESGGRPGAKSSKGATGLMQLMPATGKALGVTDPFDPAQNIMAGATYLQQMLERFGGDLTKALAAYNAGPGAVDRYGGVPPFQETQAYVPQVLERFTAMGGDLTAFHLGLQQASHALRTFSASVQAPPTPATPPTDIPALGRGGVVTRPTLAWIGERGPEAVLPLQQGGLFQGISGGRPASMSLWASLIPYLQDLLGAGRAVFGEQWLSGLIGPSLPLSEEELLGLGTGGLPMGRVGVLAGNERLASDLIKRGLKQPYFHGSPAWETILREGFDPEMVGRATGQRLGEPAGISLTRDPTMAATFSGMGPFGAPRPGILRVGVDVPPSSVGQFVDPVFIETYRRAFRTADRQAPNVVGNVTDASGLEAIGQLGAFNRELSTALRAEGVEAIAYSPRRYQEFELRVLDPTKAVPLGRLNPEHLGVTTRSPASIRSSLEAARAEVGRLEQVLTSLEPANRAQLLPQITAQRQLAQEYERLLDAMTEDPLYRFYARLQPRLAEALRAAPEFPSRLSDIIPFADGGVVTQPTVGLLGERGPEAVVPLSEGLRTLLGGEAASAGALQAASMSLQASASALQAASMSLQTVATTLQTGASALDAAAMSLQTAAAELTTAAHAMTSAPQDLGGPAAGAGANERAALPGLAMGGIVTRPTLAWIGEAGPEAVIPLQAGGVAGGSAGGGYGGVYAAIAAMAMTELLNLLLKADRPTELPFTDLGGPMILGPGTLDRLAHGTDPLTGVNPATSIQWSTAAEREAYLRPEPPSIWAQLLRLVATMGAMVGGSQLGSLGSSGGSPTMMAGSGAEGPIATAQHGLLTHGAQLALIGEAGPEAVIPLRGGHIPTMRSPSGGLLATMPSGDRVPIRLPAFATGGVLGQPITPAPLPASTTGTVWRGGQPSGTGQAGWSGPPVVIQVTTPDAASFRQSESQIMSSYAIALQRARRRHG